jgi:hypothetical protein
MPIEGLVVPWLTQTLDLRVVTELPDNLELVVPLVRVTAIGGGADPNNRRFRSPRISVDSFATGYGPAGDLAEDVDRAMHKLAGESVGGYTVTRVDTSSLPAWVPYVDTKIRHFVSAFQLFVMADR